MQLQRQCVKQFSKDKINAWITSLANTRMFSSMLFKEVIEELFRLLFTLNNSTLDPIKGLKSVGPPLLSILFMTKSNVNFHS